MGEIIIVLIKYVGVSCALWYLYVLLFKGKSSFLSQRIYLLLLPIISLIAATLSVDFVKVEADNSLGKVISAAESITDSVTEYNNFVIEDVTHSTSIFAGLLDVSNLMIFIAGLVSLIFIARYIQGVYNISEIRKLSSEYMLRNTLVYRSGLISSSFSFFKAIYINRKMDGEKLDMVLVHESAHINHKHYIDKLICEIYIMISWFNPFIWNVRREIETVHEFEADNTVLSNNFNVKRYKQYIYDELILSSPSISSGFNHSLTKQRFLQMKSNYKIKNRKLRKALTLPIIVAILVLTSFTYVNEEALASGTAKTIELINYNLNNSELDVNSEANIENSVTSEEVAVVLDTLTANTSLEEQMEQQHVKLTAKQKAELNEQSEGIKRKQRLLISRQKNNERIGVWNRGYAAHVRQEPRVDEDNHEDCNYYFLEKNQYEVAPRVRRESRYKCNIYRYKDHTEVDFHVNIPSNWYWVSFSENTYLVDKKRNVRYKIHSIKNNVPVARNIVFREEMNNIAVLTLIFPPLDRGVRKVDFIENDSETNPVPSNSAGHYFELEIPVENNRPKVKETKVVTLDPDFEL